VILAMALWASSCATLEEDVRAEARRVDGRMPSTPYSVARGPASGIEGTKLYRAGAAGDETLAHGCYADGGDVGCGPDPSAFERLVRAHELGAHPAALDDGEWVRLWAFLAGLDTEATGRVERPADGGVVLRVQHGRARDPDSGLERFDLDVVTVTRRGGVRLERSVVEADSPGPRGGVATDGPDPDPGPPRHPDESEVSPTEEVRACYERALSHDPQLGGEVAVRFIVARDGRVTTVAIARSELGGGPVERCIVQQVKRWRFAARPEGDPMIVLYPFRLAPPR